MTNITVNPTTFRARFKEFSNATIYTDTVIQAAYEQVGIFVSPINNTNVLSEAMRTSAVYIATATIMKRDKNIEAGDNGAEGVMSSASEDGVSVNFEARNFIRTAMGYELNKPIYAPYGSQLYMIIKKAQPDLSSDLSVNSIYYNATGGANGVGK